MKNKYLLVLLILLTSCSVKKKRVKNDWINLFKDYAMYKCACEVTGDKLEPLLWTTKDISFTVNKEVLGNYGDKADSIGRFYAKGIKPIAVDPESDLYGMKAMFVGCLDFYKSDSLDKIAKAAYRQYWAEKQLNSSK